MCTSWKQKQQGVGFPEAELADSCEQPYGCWELYSVPQQELSVISSHSDIILNQTEMEIMFQRIITIPIFFNDPSVIWFALVLPKKEGCCRNLTNSSRHSIWQNLELRKSSQCKEERDFSEDREITSILVWISEFCKWK